jgi:uncharacterized cofD-like protein
MMKLVHKQQSVPLKVVVIGGGTGNSTVLTGLKPWVGEGLTAIVNTFDDGGGTGKLREEYSDMLAVGDLRQCLRALSDSPAEELALLDHRFHEGSHGEQGLQGQTLGNLFLAAASQQNGGNFAEALSLVGRMYNITGKVLPASHDNRRLKITTADGQVIEGEHAAEMSDIPSLKGAKVGFDKEPTRISEEAEVAIAEADLVVLAPGDLYTSLAPCLAVEGMREALQKATAVVLVANLMNRSRHTAGFTALDYAEEYERIIGAHGVIDRVLYNTQAPDAEALAAQESIGSSFVVADPAALKAAGFVPVGKDLLSRETVQLNPNDPLAGTRSTIRHDPERVAHALMAVYFGNGFSNKTLKSKAVRSV